MHAWSHDSYQTAQNNDSLPSLVNCCGWTFYFDRLARPHFWPSMPHVTTFTQPTAPCHGFLSATGNTLTQSIFEYRRPEKEGRERHPSASATKRFGGGLKKNENVTAEAQIGQKHVFFFR